MWKYANDTVSGLLEKQILGQFRSALYNKKRCMSLITKGTYIRIMILSMNRCMYSLVFSFSPSGSKTRTFGIDDDKSIVRDAAAIVMAVN